MSRHFIIAGALLATATTLFAGEPTFSTDTALTYGFGSDAGRSMQSTIEVEPQLDFRLSDRALAVLAARARFDFSDKLEPGGIDTATWSRMSRPVSIGEIGSLELRDAYLQFRFDNGIARLGKQQIVWGRLDGVKVLDVLNPQDFREFVLDDFGASRIGLWSAYLDVSVGKWRTEFAVIPDNTGHAIPSSGAWFELVAPRFRYGATPGTPTPPIDTVLEKSGLDAPAVAVRLTRQLGSTELSAQAYKGLDHEPLGRFTFASGELRLERFYEKRKVFGVGIETVIGSIALRSELAHQPKRIFNVRTPENLTTIALDQNTWGVGIDFDGPFGTFVNVQHILDRINDAPAALVRPAQDRISTVFVRKTLSYDTLALTARWYFSHEDRDQMLSVSTRYAFADSTSLSLAFDSFSGGRSGLFGQFDGRDRITVSLVHTF